MSRFTTAWQAFWQILFNADKAITWTQLNSSTTTAVDNIPKKIEESPKQISNSDAVYTLALLQREGRLIDFLQENIEQFDDAQIGVAVRQVHAGCNKVLKENFNIQPIRTEQENSNLNIEDNFDPSRIRLTGNIPDTPPFNGTLRHRGWYAKNVKLPTRHKSLDASVVCPAEVEL